MLCGRWLKRCLSRCRQLQCLLFHELGRFLQKLRIRCNRHTLTVVVICGDRLAVLGVQDLLARGVSHVSAGGLVWLGEQGSRQVARILPYTRD